ncbi:PREDICTED: uncharacterized protein LOC104809597 isoform X1 [Tarenaya hassleriana]|uniref:uncharacterized protein LOC104809597 isoform X1 n=1 Tax=Tarenaya hassleriana TaxID=28532 RepID=UPI00053C80ED|nr:PREDICTED: uncharacterized protein LOC104809597 isoform X1 [Tarenaya hassleriana]
MKKHKMKALVKELAIGMKKQVSFRYIHIIATAIFFSSLASLVILLSMFLNHRLKPYFLSICPPPSLSYNLCYNSTNAWRHLSLSPPLLPGHYDEELMWRASMAPHGAEKRVEKVAFMFLTRGRLPLAPLWEIFFKGNEGFFSIYVHTSPEFHEEPPQSSVFYKTRIPGQAVEWGRSSMMDAERRLLSHALLDHSNSRFVLLSESCIPLFNFTFTYSYLTRSTRSFLGSFDDPRPMGRGRYRPTMLPYVSLSDWRKGNQWFELHRSVALRVVSDSRYYVVFKEHCKPPCYMDEHYLPTLVTKVCPETNSNRSVTWVDWSRGGSHPVTYVRRDIRVGLLDRIRFGFNCSYEGHFTNLCFLFGRKFHVSTLDPLLKLAPYLYGF